MRGHSDSRVRHDRCREASSSSDSAPPNRGFELVISAAHPHDTDWLDQTDWPSLLVPHGLIAVVTYSDIRGLYLHDPISAIVATFRSHGLEWWDQIILLTDPGATAPMNGAATATANPEPGVPGSSPLQARRAHHDLLLFLPAGLTSPTDDDATSTDRPGVERNTSDD